VGNTDRRARYHQPSWPASQPVQGVSEKPMITKARRANATTFFLVFLCCGLFFVIIYELTGINAVIPPLDAAVPPTPYQPTVPPIEYTSSPFEAFSEISKRPLFTRSRRPFAPPMQPTRIESFDLLLVGVLITKRQQWALLQPVQSEDTFEEDGAYHRLTKAHQGQIVNGWLLQNIEENRVIVRKGDLVRILQLHRISQEK